MAKKTIQIKCTGSTEFSLVELNDLQGELKERSPESLKRLRKSILKHGFIAPFFVWENPGTARLMIIDGHSRREVLNQMKDEGYAMPQFPVDFIDAANLDDAKAKLLAISSNYGKFTEQGVKGFLDSFDLKTDDLFETIDIPFMDLNVSNILEPDEGGTTVDVTGHTREIGKDKEDKKEKETPKHECPKCGFEWDK